MTLRDLFSVCLFGHQDPIKRVEIVKGTRTLYFECPRCQQVIRKPLPKQKYKARTPDNVTKFEQKRKAG